MIKNRKDSKMVAISMTPEKHRELKKKAIDLDMTLSELMTKTASEYDETRITGGTTNPTDR